jgi:tRNA(Ile)-lysidine synthase TilS/MesJ
MAEKVPFVEDPTNRNEAVSLRNWLRKAWLPALEERARGARHTLARSLAQLASDDFTETIGPYVGLRREALVCASPLQRKDIVARYFRSLGMKNYSQAHVQEVLKRLSTRRKPVPFEMLGHSFNCSPDFLWASRV